MMVILAVPAPTSAQDGNFLISIDGPETLIPGEKAVYTVNVAGGPGSGAIKYNATAGNGGAVTPKSGSTTANSFNFTVTAPSKVGEFTVTFGVSNENGSIANTAQHTIRVVEPVVISAKLTNSANVEATGVPVQIYVDGNLVGNITVTIPASSTRTVTYNWSVAGLSAGQHAVKMVVDPDNQFVRFADGGTVFEDSFYVGDAGWGLANILLTVIFALLLLVVFFTYMSRGRKKKKRPRA